MTALGSILSRHVGGLPREFWWLWSGAVVNSLANFVFPFIALFLSARGFSVQQVGAVVAMFGLGSIISGPVSGFLADRLGRRPTLVFSIAGAAAVTAVLGSLTSVAAIVGCIIALGLVANAFRPALNAVVADLVSPEDRPRAFGLIYWGVNTALIFSLIAGGLLAARGYETLFLVDAATTAAFGIVVWLKVQETNPIWIGGERNPDAPSARGYDVVLSDHAFLSFLVVNFFFIMIFWQFQVAAPIDMARHGLGPEQYGRVFAVNGFLIASLQPFSARLTQRFDSAHILAVASALVGIGYGAYAFCSTPTQYALAVAVWSIGEILALPVAAALVADLSPRDLRGRYQGAYSLSFSLGMFFASMLGATCMERLGARALWAACFGMSLLVAIGHLVIGQSRRHPKVIADPSVAGGASPG